MSSSKCKDINIDKYSMQTLTFYTERVIIISCLSTKDYRYLSGSTHFTCFRKKPLKIQYFPWKCHIVGWKLFRCVRQQRMHKGTNWVRGWSNVNTSSVPCGPYLVTEASTKNTQCKHTSTLSHLHPFPTTTYDHGFSLYLMTCSLNSDVLFIDIAPVQRSKPGTLRAAFL